MTVLASPVDWTIVLSHLFLALPAIIAAVYAGRIHRQVKTPSGKSIGAQVEDVNHTTISNNQKLHAIDTKVNGGGS